MFRLDSRSLDRRIRIERSVPVFDGYNNFDQWNELATVWASYRPSAGREAREAAGREATLPATFRVRWQQLLTDLGPADRLLYPAPSGQAFDIKSVVEIGRREGIEILGLARVRQLTQAEIDALAAGSG